MQTYTTSICVSERAANKHINDNIDQFMNDFGPSVYEHIGMEILKIFHKAVITVKYKDIFDDVKCPTLYTYY
jgi:hypothetical protein